MIAKVINIMASPPAYELFLNEPRPEINWDTPDGLWVGLWGLDWADQIGREVLNLTDEFEYEVWQPDLRADKIYTHIFENRLVRRLFPAIYKKEIFGYRLINRIYSSNLVREFAKQVKREKIILHLNGDPLLYKNFFPFLGSVPVISTYHGVIHLPSTRLFSRTMDLPSKLNHIMDYYLLRKAINDIDYITYQNDTNLDYLKKIYIGTLCKVTVGCDFSFWRVHNRIASRKKLGLSANKRIFLSASLLTNLKQIDKLIAVFARLNSDYDFLLIVAGHGLDRYEDYLTSLSSDLLRTNKIQFVGHLRHKDLLDYYNACDFFISTSRQEGGPVSVMQAFACEVPVISTRTGHTAGLMEQYHCGCLLDIYDYDMWKNEIEEILEGKKVVRPMDREIAKKHYDWPNVAQKFKDIYEHLAQEYYS